jgi:hypothetical protein
MNKVNLETLLVLPRREVAVCTAAALIKIQEVLHVLSLSLYFLLSIRNLGCCSPIPAERTAYNVECVKLITWVVNKNYPWETNGRAFDFETNDTPSSSISNSLTIEFDRQSREDSEGMSKLNVNLKKLERYAGLHGGYEIHRDQGQVFLTFSPVFPEALEKSDSSTPPRITMSGTVSEDGKRVQFTKVEIEDASGTRERDIKEAELVYESWLEYIEENY